MNSRRLIDATSELSKLVGSPPPVMPYLLRGSTKLTGRWINDPYEGHISPMNEHVIAATFHGNGIAHARVDGKYTRSRTLPGGITMAPKGHDGDWQITGRVVVTNIYLGHERLLGCADQVAEGRAFELLDRFNEPDPKLFSIMQIIGDEIDCPRQHSMLFIEQMLDAFCLQLLREHSTLGNPVEQMQHGLANWQVKRVSAYMRDNLGADISLQDLADVVGMSRFHFCSAFRSATGAPPHEFLTRLRIKAACELLKDHRTPIHAVSLAVGYTTPSAFSATFRRIVGVTPRRYRQNL